MRLNIDFDWKFFKGDIRGAEKPEYDDKHWRETNLPHDWSIEGPFDKNNPTGGSGGYLPAGIGWYRKHFKASESWLGKKAFIEFDGVYMNCDVSMNGTHLGSHFYGYTSFSYDVTPFLNYGEKENIISLRVDNSKQPNSRWYTGSGIYRHVWLVLAEPVHIGRWGTYVVVPEMKEDFAIVRATTTIKNESPSNREAELHTYVIDREDRIAASDISAFEAGAGRDCTVAQEVKVHGPHPWSVHTPYMYVLKSEIIQHGNVVDRYETPFGMRKIDFDADRGFLLNNEAVKINGACLHHDGGCVGAAVPERVLERRLELLKEMGCNAIRTSHNPPSPELLEMCDRMGFLVMDEAFDEWAIPKLKNEDDRYGYCEHFDADAIEDLKSILYRDRNHPSIILWSVGNEIPEQTTPDGPGILKRLVDVCHEIDPTRPVASACDNIKAQPMETSDAFLELLDVVGYNYVNRWQGRTETFYAEDHHRHPQRKVIGSEHYSTRGIRGDYSDRRENKDPFWKPYNTRMMMAEHLWRFTKAYDYVSGDFMWTGIDYLGEASWPFKSASAGVLDTCGYPKDGYYFYQSQWTDKPVLHLFPHWTWKGLEGKVMPVLCYTNCASVELFLNGRSFGVKSYEFPRQGMTERYLHFDRPYVDVTTSDLHLAWDVPYEPGELEAVGTRNGTVICERTIMTAGDPAGIELAADRKTVFSDGRDVCHITVRVTDDKGNLCPCADNLIHFRIEGEGRLIGVDNGKPDSHESFRVEYRKAFNGLCLAIVQSTSNPGEISVHASSDGLAPDSLGIASSRNPGDFDNWPTEDAS